jgi:hypothetical protein
MVKYSTRQNPDFVAFFATVVCNYRGYLMAIEIALSTSFVRFGWFVRKVCSVQKRWCPVCQVALCVENPAIHTIVSSYVRECQCPGQIRQYLPTGETTRPSVFSFIYFQV